MLQLNGNLSCEIGGQLFSRSSACFNALDFGASVDLQLACVMVLSWKRIGDLDFVNKVIHYVIFV